MVLLLKLSLLGFALTQVISYHSSKSIYKYKYNIKLYESLNSEELMEFMVNKSNTLATKKAFFRVWTTAEKLLVEKEIQKEKFEKEILNIQNKIDNLTNDFEKCQSSLISFNARALIEYVENWKMTKTNNLTRKQKWSKYLSSDDGKALFECIEGKNRMWGDTAETVAGNITAVYSVTSNQFHSTSHGIAEGNSVVLEKLESVLQEFNLSACIASVYGIAWEVPLKSQKSNLDASDDN